MKNNLSGILLITEVCGCKSPTMNGSIEAEELQSAISESKHLPMDDIYGYWLGQYYKFSDVI